MLRYENYVRFSLEGRLHLLESEFESAKTDRRAIITAEKEALIADYDVFVALASLIPSFPEHLYERAFPKRSHDGVVYLRLKPEDKGEVIEFLSRFEAAPLAHREGERNVMPWTAQSGFHRIFPYIFLIKTHPNFLCRMMWAIEVGRGCFAFVRMQLPECFCDAVFDRELGVLRESVYVPGQTPYVYVKSNQYGRQIGLHFPRAVLSASEGPSRVLSWRDIPLFRETPGVE